MLNHELAAQAAMYTVELSKANAFIQNHAHKRVQQTAAALHDLRNTSSSIESALMILSLDIENTQTAVKAIVTKIESVIAAQFEPVTHALINEHSTETAIDLPAEEESLSSLISKVQQDIQAFTEHLNNAGNSIDAAQHEQRGMLSDMLDMSQIEAGSLILQPTVADLRELTTRAIQILEPQAAQKHCAITTATDTTVTAWCDPKRIGRVLHNIINNAVKYSFACRPSGGEVHIEIFQDNDYAICRISDDGLGIPADTLAHLNTHFQSADRITTSASITGIGLSFCKAIITASNGDLQITSEGHSYGTTVTTQLPTRVMSNCQRRSIDSK